MPTVLSSLAACLKMPGIRDRLPSTERRHHVVLCAPHVVGHCKLQEAGPDVTLA